MTTPTDTGITTTITHDLAWLKTHLILLAIVGVLILAGVYGITSLLSKQAHENFLQEQTLLQTMTKQNDQTQQATKAQIEALTQQNTVMQQQFTSLVATISARDAQLFKDREQVKTLPPPQLAVKWGQVANEPAPSIDANGNFLAPFPLAQKSTDALLALPVLTKDNTDLKTQVIVQQSIASNNNDKFLQEVKAHDSDKNTCTQTIATKDAEIKDIKRAATKREIIISIVSAILGFAARR